MIYIQSLTLPSKLQGDSFAQFTRSRYLPAIREREGSRAWDEISLLRRTLPQSTGGSPVSSEFLIFAEGSSPSTELLSTDDPALERLFAAYSPEVRPLGWFASIS